MALGTWLSTQTAALLANSTYVFSRLKFLIGLAQDWWERASPQFRSERGLAEYDFGQGHIQIMKVNQHPLAAALRTTVN